MEAAQEEGALLVLGSSVINKLFTTQKDICQILRTVDVISTDSLPGLVIIHSNTPQLKNTRILYMYLSLHQCFKSFLSMKTHTRTEVKTSQNKPKSLGYPLWHREVPVPMKPEQAEQPSTMWAHHLFAKVQASGVSDGRQR